jgi:hypothetical protein
MSFGFNLARFAVSRSGGRGTQGANKKSAPAHSTLERKSVLHYKSIHRIRQDRKEKLINDKEGQQMSKVKPGDILRCEVCGLAVIVDEECGCAFADLICCEELMANKGPRPPKKAAAAKKKTAVKKAKPAVKKPAVKKALPKPAAKKNPVKK